MAAQSPSFQESKEKGNEAVKNDKHAEAIFYYSDALRLDPGAYQIYSNRSLAFLKIQQYYLAYEDALKCIELRPDWAKGYFRKAEAEFAAEHFAEAALSYKRAIEICGDDPTCEQQMKKAKKLHIKQMNDDLQLPWIGAGVGFIAGIMIIVSEIVMRPQPLLIHPLYMIPVVLSCAVIGFFLVRWHRSYMKSYRVGLLKEPMDLLSGFMKDSEKKSQ